MASAASEAAIASPRGKARAQARGVGDAATAAWLCAIPCAVVAAVVTLLLGPPLSHVLYPAKLPFTYLPNVILHPEPVEGTRYALSLSGPLLLAAAIAFAARRPAPLPPRAASAAAGVVQLLAAGVVVACFVKQREAGWELAFFAPWQLVAAAAIAAALAWAAAGGRLTGRGPDPRALRIAAPALVALLAGLWFLSFLNTDQSIWWAGDPYNTGFMYDESFAVLNGLTPLVDFTPAYGAVWPFLVAPWMLVFGKTVLAFTFAMWTLAIVTMLAIYGALRRVTQHALAALGLTLPIVAFAFFAAVRDVHHPLAIFQEMPLRNVGPFIVAWLLARQLDGPRRAPWPLFVVAGLALLNNVEFGLAALAGAVAALIWTSAPLNARALLRIVAHAAAGVAGAYALLAVVALARAGALPDPGRAVAFARIFGLGGFGLDRLPHLIGLPLVVYLTYAAALGVATVRAATGAPNRVLTGMLAWSAIYGFGSGAYYMGESVPRGIPTTFPAWSFALALLTVAAVAQLAARTRRPPLLAPVAALLGFGLVASFALDPPASLLPWRQLATIEHRRVEPLIEQAMQIGTPLAAPRDPALRAFVGAAPERGGADVVRRGEPIALLWSTGHAIADGYGLRDVVPYVGESTLTYEQLDETLRRLRAAGGRIVLVPELILGRLAQPLAERGFRVLTRSGFRRGIPGATIEPEQLVVVHGLTKWLDERAGGSAG
jgi:hypothetical protein